MLTTSAMAEALAMRVVRSAIAIRIVRNSKDDRLIVQSALFVYA